MRSSTTSFHSESVAYIRTAPGQRQPLTRSPDRDHFAKRMQLVRQLFFADDRMVIYRATADL
jgi:hypothetical protein